MAGLLDLFGERSPEDPVNYGLLQMSQALGTPVSRGGGIGAAFGAYGHGLQAQQQLLSRQKLMEAQSAHYLDAQKNSLMPANVRTAMWYADPSRTDKEKEAYRSTVRAQENKMIGDMLFVKDFDTQQWRPANPIEQQLMTISQGAFAKEAGKQSAASTYDLQPGVDANNNDVFSTRANQLRNMGVPMAGAPGAPPQYQPPPQVSAPQLAPQGVPQPMSKPNQDAVGLDAANGYPSTAALQQALNLQIRPPAAGNANRALKVNEAEVLGKYNGDMYQGFVKSGIEAQQTIAKLDRFEQLLQGIDTGKLTPMGTEIAGYLKGIGIDIDPKLDNKQAANSLSKEMALMLRKPGKESGGMPGNFSDQDRNFLTAIAPSLANTPGGNQMIIQLSRKIAQRDAEMADLADTYRSQNNGSMDGFAKVQRAYAAAHPLFTESDKKAVAAPKSEFSVGQRSKTKDGRDVEYDGTGWKLVK